MGYVHVQTTRAQVLIEAAGARGLWLCCARGLAALFALNGTSFAHLAVLCHVGWLIGVDWLRGSVPNHHTPCRWRTPSPGPSRDRPSGPGPRDSRPVLAIRRLRASLRVRSCVYVRVVNWMGWVPRECGRTWHIPRSLLPIRPHTPPEHRRPRQRTPAIVSRTAPASMLRHIPAHGALTHHRTRAHTTVTVVPQDRNPCTSTVPPHRILAARAFSMPPTPFLWFLALRIPCWPV